RGNTRDQHSRNFDHTGEIVNWAPPALPAAARAPRAATPPPRRLMGLSPPVIEVITFGGCVCCASQQVFAAAVATRAAPLSLRSAASERNVVDAQKRTHAMQQMALAGRHPLRPRRGCYLGAIPISAPSSMAVSMARPLSVSVYTPLSRLCAMNPRMAMD